MTVVTVDDLHTVENPEQRLAAAAALARVQAGGQHDRVVVRCPDRQTDGIRCLGVEDIADLIRRHGRIVEIGVTGGGTICAAVDVCDRRGEVAVWTGQAIGPWHPEDIGKRGLGGSETAAVRLADNLAAMGYLVTLYGDFNDKAGLAGDVLCRRYQEFDPSRHLDALIGFRNATLFDHRPNADFACLWLEDLAPAEGLTPARLENVDRVCAVSHWHRQQVYRAHPWIERRPEYHNKVKACRNGIMTEWFREEPAPDRELRVVYSSSPDRGGDIVLECWPEVRKHVPDAELILTYPRWFDLCAERFQAAHGHLARIRGLLEQPGVSRVEGGLGQKRLAHLMRSSMVWVAPSYYTPARMKFEETSCISCMEAQAAGLVVVASNWGALTENVRYGALLNGDPADPTGDWRKQFVAAIVRGLTDETMQKAAQVTGPDMMRGMGWRGAAEQLAAMFPRRFKWGGVVGPAAGRRSLVEHHPV
jgi:glycosyltransferase involved in cell wall biosynthesis